MEERLIKHIYIAMIVLCFSMIIMIMAVAIDLSSKSIEIIDRIEQLEADLDRMERSINNNNK